MKYLGIDFGLKRVGLAISEGQLASPWQILRVQNFKDAVDKTSKVIKEESFEIIIIGLPEGKIGKTVLKFVKALKKIGLDVETADETLSSQDALAQMIELNTSKKDRQESDATAAAIILQNYLDNR